MKLNELEKFNELEKRVLLCFLSANFSSSLTKLVNESSLEEAIEAVKKFERTSKDSAKREQLKNLLSNFSAEKEIKRCERFGIEIIQPNSKNWFSELNCLDLEKPILIFKKGSFKTENLEKSVSVVGSRITSEYGRKICFETAFDLTKKGFSVVSGGALGIDIIAHTSCLEAGGKTLAVLANGLDQFYPTANFAKFNQILENEGGIISEFLPQTTPKSFRFLERNRIIAALSLITVVVEAPWRSGSLSTANHALGLGKYVAAFPGNVDQVNSSGTNRLIQNGGSLITSAEDVIELVSKKIDLGLLDRIEKVKSLEVVEKDVFDLLKDKHKLNDIQKKLSKYTVNRVFSAIGYLELIGLINRNSNEEYVQTKN